MTATDGVEKVDLFCLNKSWTGGWDSDLDGLFGSEKGLDFRTRHDFHLFSPNQRMTPEFSQLPSSTFHWYPCNQSSFKSNLFFTTKTCLKLETSKENITLSTFPLHPSLFQKKIEAFFHRWFVEGVVSGPTRPTHHDLDCNFELDRIEFSIPQKSHQVEDVFCSFLFHFVCFCLFDCFLFCLFVIVCYCLLLFVVFCYCLFFVCLFVCLFACLFVCLFVLFSFFLFCFFVCLL